MLEKFGIVKVHSYRTARVGGLVLPRAAMNAVRERIPRRTRENHNGVILGPQDDNGYIRHSGRIAVMFADFMAVVAEADRVEVLG